MQFIRDNPDKSTKRDIAKAFSIRGDDRIELKRMLRSLADDGLIGTSRKRYAERGDLPAVGVMTIFDVTDDGDLIAEPQKWDDPDNKPPRILISQSKRDKGRAPGVGDQVLGRIVERGAGSDGLPGIVAKIIKVLPKRPSSVLGVVKFGAHAGELPRLIPVDRKRNEIEIDELDGATDGDLVSVVVTKIGRYGLERARVLERIGAIGSEKAISQIALHEHEIPHIFPNAVINAAEAAGPVVLDGDREDWRHIPLVTIDPADAKDHDDAIFAEPDDNENNPQGHVLIIAIADVSHYVERGSVLDAEAFNRGNSVYFPDRVVPMLPEQISNNLCSLKENVDRPALAARIVIDANGMKRKHSFHRIMMRSHASLSYEEAQDALDGKVSERAGSVLEKTLKPLHRAYKSILKERSDREPLELNVPERKVKLNDDGRVREVIVPRRLTTHKLIEEFMILANVAAAESLTDKRVPLIFRAHDAPSLAKLEALRDFLSTLDLQIPKQGNIRPHHFNRILNGVSGENHEVLTNQVILRSQAQAEYTPENYGHFGLNLKKYAHFTSPIRRYADLVVHRALVSAHGLGSGGLGDIDLDTLSEISEHISATERRAMAAERATIDRLIADWLADKVGASFWGRIGGVTKAGLFISLDETGADGFIPISTLGDDYYHFDEARHALTGERTHQTYQLGDRVEVKLVEALPFAGALRFEMLSEGTKGKGPRILPKPRGKRRSSGRSAGPPKGVSRKVRRKR